MKHLFIVNPAAGKAGNEGALLEQIDRLDLDSVVVHTQRQEEACEIARAAAQSGEPLRIYACGGDGTLNEVINGVAGLDHVAVTNVPLGTGNDFLKIFGPENKDKFSQLEQLSQGPQVAMDLMECNGKLGLDIFCAGVDARIAADVHKYRRLPLVRGIGAYILSLIANVLWKGISRPTRVEAEEYAYEGETAIVCVCNGRYYGGGFMPVGDNLPDDGKLEMLVVPKVSRRTFFRLVGEYAKGRYRQHPDLITAVEGTEFTITAPQPLVAVVDGEMLEQKRYHIRLSEKKVNFFYPQGLSYQPRVEESN
ncbi:diacylglycerol kinase family protein [Pseudoflavonifractor sp. An85]|uniref:diacylglycerol/lipid kinase family protein n=1 Tax=Pseudoflavonifractor sp. An85 TaxID=1965661 RepID=UPI000B38895D|nr:diacylglycerol kinase family protein [Pseudoflavonifractor sp. An85]OUN24788.1 BmrU protein [Pseudoflavonifractor sp. An85]